MSATATATVENHHESEAEAESTVLYTKIGENLQSMFSLLANKVIKELKTEYKLPIYDDEVTYYDHSYILPVPKDIYQNQIVMAYISGLIRSICKKYSVGLSSVEYKENASYDSNWCGSRCHTYNVAHHIAFNIGISADKHIVTGLVIREYCPWKCSTTNISYEVDKTDDLTSLSKQYQMPIHCGYYTFVIECEYV
jgi:hypothetical protein